MPFGVTVPWGPLESVSIAATSEIIGGAPNYLLWYTGFDDAPDVTKLQATVDLGAIPVVTWEPWEWTEGVNQPTYRLSTFTAGSHDAYMTRFADSLAAWDGPVMLRWGHEMNGNWYPWAAAVNGNTAAEYVAAWRHIHDLFERRGADNVQWVWSPNAPHSGSTPLAELYPGHDYVDVIGFDGYNWGTAQAGREWWSSPSQIFDATFAEVRRLAPGKPFIITETASSEHGGDKAAWVADLFVWAAEQPDLVGVIWFDENETDWRIASSQASITAFRMALSAPV